MVKRREAVSILKNELARRIEAALADFGAVRCEDDTRVVKVDGRIQHDSWGERCDEPTEFEVYIREVQG